MTGATFTCHWQTIDELAPRALYSLLKLRVDVFVVEQKCPYPEIDGQDIDAFHLRVLDGDNLAGALRVLPNPDGEAVKIGRVVVAPDCRGMKLGDRLMREAVDFVTKTFPDRPMELGAQSHLQRFYGSFGFVPISPEYLEDGIPHIDMRFDPHGAK